jgi:(R)-amidase
MPDLRIALAQLRGDDGDIGKNMDRVAEVARGVGAHHDVVVFPEAYAIGFPSREATRALAEPLDGPIVQTLTRLASACATTLVIGVPEREGEGVFNTTVMVTPAGLTLAYRKVHLWRSERTRVDTGNAFGTTCLGDTRVGILICYDIEFPETARALASLGAQVAFVTNGNMDPYGPVHHVCLRARAQENQMYVAMANRVGEAQGTVYAGGSGVANPYGRVLCEAGRDEDVLSATLSLQDLAESRRAYDYLQERRIGIGVSRPTVDHETYAAVIKTGDQAVRTA